MKQEINPAIMIAIAVAAVALLVFIFFRTTAPAGVKTEKPTKPNPPGGAIVVQ